MRTGWPWHRHVFRLLLRGAWCGIALALLALAWNSGRAPAVPVAHAAGVPYCPNPMPNEHAPTRPAPHLNRTEGPPDTQLTFTASGWRPGGHVTLHFDGRDPKTGKLHILIPDFAQGVVASDGTVTLSSLRAPSFTCVDMVSYPTISYSYGDAAGDETGYFTLTADDGAASAPVAFRYLPPPLVAVNTGGANAQQVKVGATITVFGSGWETYEPLRLILVDGRGIAALPNASPVHVTTDSRGVFTKTYRLDARLPWNRDALLMVEGTGPRFGTLDEFGYIFLLPAVQPTFHIDQTVVTPGMTITVSGEHWYPGATYTIKYCAAQWWKGAWIEGGNCGKSSNPALGNVTVDSLGHMRQRLTIPADVSPGVIMVRVTEVAGWIGTPEVAVHVVDHLPTWDEIHPRVAALRNTVVGSLPVTLPAVALLGTLVFVGIRRWRGRRPVV